MNMRQPLAEQNVMKIIRSWKEAAPDFESHLIHTESSVRDTEIRDTETFSAL